MLKQFIFKKKSNVRGTSEKCTDLVSTVLKSVHVLKLQLKKILLQLEANREATSSNSILTTSI